MQKVLVINPENCTGCRICELACSLFHEGRCNSAESRITNIKYEELNIYIPMSCQNCESPVCMEVCPVDAIYRDESTKAILIDDTRCIGCKLCLMACPIGGIALHPITMKVIKCDLCGGEPKCVEFCPDNALEYLSSAEVAIRKRRDKTKEFAAFLAKAVGEKLPEAAP